MMIMLTMTLSNSIHMKIPGMIYFTLVQFAEENI